MAHAYATRKEPVNYEQSALALAREIVEIWSRHTLTSLDERSLSKVVRKGLSITMPAALTSESAACSPANL